MKIYYVTLCIFCMSFLSESQNQDLFITTWKTDNSGVSSDTQITIPTFSGETYDYEVDWTYDANDGFTAESTNQTGDATHDYGVAGIYTVAIRGAFPRIYFANSGDRDKILTIQQWGTIAWTSMENAFRNCSYLNITNINILFMYLHRIVSI